MKNHRTPVRPNEEPNSLPVRQAIDNPRVFISRKIEQAGGSEALARRIRETGIVTQMNRPVLEHWTREPNSFDGIDPVTRTLRLIQATDNLLPLQWLCGRMGCYFVHGQRHFDSIVGKGATTWFNISLQLHEIRRTTIDALQGNNSTSFPEISLEEARLISKSWASVFAWIEGYLHRCRGIPQQPVAQVSEHGFIPVLFRATEAWRVILECLKGHSREAVSEAIAHPFGAAVKRNGDLHFPRKETLNKWMQSRGEKSNTAHGSRGPLDYTLALCHATGSIEPVAWLADNVGGHLVFPQSSRGTVMTQAELLKFWERSMVELSELDAALARAHMDGMVCPKELQLLDKEWQDVVEWMASFVASW